MLSATEDERRRFARELHDEIAQLLTVIQLSLHDVPTESPQVQRARELLVRTQAEIHRIIHDLRPSLLDDLGLADAKWTDDQLLDFIVMHPILMNRPIVVTPKGTRLCRPSEAVLEILPVPTVPLVLPYICCK